MNLTATKERFRLQIPVVVRYITLFALAMLVFALVLLLAGRDPIQAYRDIISNTLGSRYGFSEVLVKFIPLALAGIAVAVPSKIGLINVGAEGQIYMGAWLASWAALSFTELPAWILLPFMVVCGFVGGGVWAALAGFMRAKGWVNETISTLLMNYIAILIVNLFIFGPWKEPLSSNFPQSPLFVDAARLPQFFGTRVHFGLLFALIAIPLFAFFLNKTRWGLEMRSIGGNPEAARRNGIPIFWYMVIIMLIGGGIAGIAGMGEVSAINGRLRPSLSTGFGFTGFLISWLANGNPWGILVMAFVLAVISSGGDILQITQGLPYSVVNILMSLILFMVLARGNWKGSK
jgi:general nucleoside transport system permease protein